MKITVIDENKNVTPGEIKISIDDNYSVEEMKQLIALETGNILATSSFIIPLTKERLRKILYLRNILSEQDIIIKDPVIFNYITDEELDGLIGLFEKGGCIISNSAQVNNSDVVIWKILTWQIFKKNTNIDLYADIDDDKKFGGSSEWSKKKILGAIYSDPDLLINYLNYINDGVVGLDYDRKVRIYKTIKWFAKNDFFTKYYDVYANAKFANLIADIEAICFYVCSNFNVCTIFSIIKYFILINSPIDFLFRSILSFKPTYFFKQRINRNERRRILEQIDHLCAVGLPSKINNKFKSYLKAIDKRLHPSDYKDVFPKAYEFFMIYRNRPKTRPDDFISSEISKLYEQKDISVTEIASLVYKKYPVVFINRFDSFARRAEKDGKESELIDILIDANLSYYELECLERKYTKKLNKIRARENNENNKVDDIDYVPFFVKPSANVDFIECALDIIRYKKKSKENDMTGDDLSL